jgi:hypothetical protein
LTRLVWIVPHSCQTVEPKWVLLFVCRYGDKLQKVKMTICD